MSTPVNETPTTAPAPYGGAAVSPGRPWTAGRVIAFVLGALVVLLSLGALVTGVAALVIDQSQRTSDGFVEAGPVELESNGYAVAAVGLHVDTTVPGWLQLRSVFGDIRVTAESTDGEAIFVGVAPEEAAAAYLGATAYDEVSRISGGSVTYIPHTGAAPASPPAAQDFWAAWTEGSGEQTLTVDLDTGDWVVVVMNADANAPVAVTASAAAELPVLPWMGIVLLVIGGVGVVIASLVIYLAAREQ
jgi:hypothetical protein